MRILPDGSKSLIPAEWTDFNVTARFSKRSVVCGKGPIFAEATAQPRLPHLDPPQIRKPEATPAPPVTLLSSSEQFGADHDRIIASVKGASGPRKG